MSKTAKIPKVRFNLKNYLDKDGEKQILAVFRYPQSKTRLVYYTGEKLKPKWWGKKRAKESVNFSGGVRINNNLNEIEAQILDIYDSSKNLSTDVFRDEIDYRRGIKVRPSLETGQKSLYQFIEELIIERKIDVEGKSGQTWQKFKTVLNHIKKFAKENYTRELTFDDINEDFKKDFSKWLYKKPRNHSQNTVAKTITVTKQFLSLSKKYHHNKYYEDDSFKVDRKHVPKHFPTLTELKHLFNFKFIKEGLQTAVDLYCISAFGGGLRWSDVVRLNEDNEIVDEDVKVLQVFTYKGRNTKNDNEVIIPITPQLRALINKYNWTLPKMSEQNVNRNIKDAFELAGLDRKVNVKSAKKGSKMEVKRLHEVVTFHTARYAYINYMVNDLEIPVQQLQKITGQSLSILMGYERGDKKKNARKVGAKINKQLEGLHVVKSEAV